MQLMSLPKRKERKKWKICIDHPFQNCSRIYPIQQQKVSRIVEHLRKNINVKRIIVFGSSVTERCHIDSDVDIYVELNYLEHLTFPAFDFVYDLWTNDTVDERMLEEIMKKGVVVYERNVIG